MYCVDDVTKAGIMSEFPRIFAHRGASALAPENTMAAFVKAFEVGARWFEFDVDIMGDGTLLVIHDDTLDRTTNGSGSYATMGFGDLRKLDAGAWFSPTYRFERIPECASVVEFANAHRMGMNLEIKPNMVSEEARQQLVENVAVATDSVADKSRFIVSSFDGRLLFALKELRPELAFGWLVDPEDERTHWRNGAVELGAKAVHPGLEGLTREEVQELRSLGFDVNVWTVNDVDTARELAEWGVTGIFTDNPQLFPAEALNN